MPSSGVQTCALDRKSTRLNSSHTIISYAVFCLKKDVRTPGGGGDVGHLRDDAVRGPERRRDATASSRPRPENPPRTIWPPPTRPPFFFNDTATTEIYTLSLHDALPI